MAPPDTRRNRRRRPTSPALFLWFKEYNGWSTHWSLAATVGAVIVFRGFADLLFRRLIPWPSLFGADSAQLREEDVMGRRRTWYWRKKARLATILASVITVVWLIRGGSWLGTGVDVLSGLASAFSNPAVLTQIVFVTFLFIANFAILMGPMLLMGISQIRGFEPGDAQWGVKLGDVRGQVEAKEEVRRVVTLWQSGEAFERAGGKRERGLLFLGAPEPARRCSPRRSPRDSTRRSSRSPVRGSRRPSSASTRSSSATWRGRRSGSLASGAASASSSSTRSTPWACAARRSAAALRSGASPRPTSPTTSSSARTAR